MIQKLRELWQDGIGCKHEQIYIDGFRDGAKADYKCSSCGSRVYPQESDKKYVYDSGYYRQKE